MAAQSVHAANLVVRGQTIVSHADGVLPQKRTRWCHAYAARAVLSQYLCARTQTCVTPEQMAVGTFLRDSDWWEGGDPARTLANMSRGGYPLAERACTFEAPLLKLDDGSPEELAVTLRLRQQSVTALPPELAWLAEPMARAKGDFTRLSEEILLPRACAARAPWVTPPFQVRGSTILDLGKLTATIEKALARDRMVGVNLCAGTLDSRLGACGPHSTAVAGRRELCEGEDCRLQFLLYDSSFTLGDATWVDATLLARASVAVSLESRSELAKAREAYRLSMRRMLDGALARRAHAPSAMLPELDRFIEELRKEADGPPLADLAATNVYWLE